MKPKFYDCLKYWKVIRQWVKARYELDQADLDMLLFLYTENYFNRAMFQEFNNIISWDTDRFNRLLRENWIEGHRESAHNTRAVYRLTYKSKRMIYSIYQKLSGEDIPTNATNNPMFARNVKYTDKIYRNFIKQMTKDRKEDRISDSEL
jgi:hypothetical protein